MLSPALLNAPVVPAMMDRTHQALTIVAARQNSICSTVAVSFHATITDVTPRAGFCAMSA
jgi:hypothetical protein